MKRFHLEAVNEPDGPYVVVDGATKETVSAPLNKIVAGVYMRHLETTSPLPPGWTELYNGDT